MSVKVETTHTRENVQNLMNVHNNQYRMDFRGQINNATYLNTNFRYIISGSDPGQSCMFPTIAAEESRRSIMLWKKLCCGCMDAVYDRTPINKIVLLPIPQ